ncbi:hypothetical protein CDSM653_00729 [Caldanaerobacter subterraneus subsp. pacificus DSM 12653]|uniref:Uncharacterized protein n=1 Tax=Caldanaerobacter subterraneus subsp. pacificus DSM 12653 TaxID=391606 RepID=A0A0F5PNS5_9THEO|nr:hypothetical protein CDSM653_00729 [Caldanaerobacter subterraneus subsp. pacificus DSM 12653]
MGIQKKYPPQLLTKSLCFYMVKAIETAIKVIVKAMA